MPCTSTSAAAALPCPAAGVTSAAGRAVMNGSSRKICFASRMRRQTALAKKGRTASKSSLSASAGSSSCKSVCRLTSASRSGAGPSNGTLCIKAWMAVPRSAPVMLVFCKNAGRSSATGRAAWATALTLTLAGTFSSASRGLRQAKLAFSISTTAGSAAGAGGAGGCSVSSGRGSTRMASGARCSP